MATALSGKVREITGKKATKKARRESFLPAVLYGLKDNISLMVNPRDLSQIVAEHGMTGLIDLSIDGDSQKQRKVILHAFQAHPLRETWVHADFLEIDMNKKVRVQIPIRLEGHSPGEKQGGIINHISKLLDIECLPGDIPNEFVVDMTKVELNQIVHVSDLDISDKIQVHSRPENGVVRVYIEKVKEEEKPEEEALAEGEAPKAEDADAAEESKKEPKKEEGK